MQKSATPLITEREGYIEILTMADIVQGAANTNKRALYDATKHSPAGVAICGSVLTALTRENAAEYMEVPTTGLMTSWLIVNTSKHLVYSGDAAAIEARGPQGEPAYGRLVYWDQRPTPLTASEVAAHTADPLFTGSYVAAARYDLPDLSTPYLPGSTVTPAQQALQLSDAIAARTVAGEFFNLASLGASTDWVVSFPTRRLSRWRQRAHAP